MTTFGTAKWQGGLKDGKGAISTKSGALNEYPYGFASRFEGKPGTNPEELIGAAHAGCFTMALSLILSEAGFTATEMNTKAEITLEKKDDGFAITKSHLTLRAKILGIACATLYRIRKDDKADTMKSRGRATVASQLQLSPKNPMYQLTLAHERLIAVNNQIEELTAERDKLTGKIDVLAKKAVEALRSEKK